jgi:hypothetical protein
MNLRERELLNAVSTGTPLVCGSLEPSQLAHTDDVNNMIGADVIRDIVRGKYELPLDPRGVRLKAARVTGALNLDSVRGVVGIKLISCWLDEPITAFDAQLPWLSLRGTYLPYLHAERLRVDGSVFLTGLHVQGVSKLGSVRIPTSHIGGNLECNNARLDNRGGPCIYADGLKVDGSVYLNRTQFDGHSNDAAIRLYGARIGGNLECDSMMLRNVAGPAFRADGVHVDGSMFLRGFSGQGNGSVACIRLSSGSVGARLDLHDAHVHNAAGPILDLRSTAVNVARIPAKIICEATFSERQPCGGEGKVLLDGFTYAALDEDDANWSQWLHLIRRHTLVYRAQPYRQLAAINRAAGHDAVARRVLIAQQDELAAAGGLGGDAARLRHRFLRLIAGYGYQTWRAVVGLAGVVTLAIALGLAAGHVRTDTGGYSAIHTISTANPGTPCSTIEQVGLGVDRGLPLINTGLRNRCDFDTSSTTGQIFTAIAWLLQLAAWAMATIVIAGYTGLIRRSNQS